MKNNTITIRVITGCIHYAGEEFVAGGAPFVCEAGEAARLIELGVAEEFSGAAAPAAPEPPDLLAIIAAVRTPAELLALMPDEEPTDEVRSAFENRLAELEK